MSAALVFAACDVLGAAVLTLVAAWLAWRKHSALWPVLVSAVGVVALYVLHYDLLLAKVFIGQRAIPAAWIVVASIMIWLHRHRVGDGVRRALALPPRTDGRPYAFAALNLALALAVVILAYDAQAFRDYRVLAPHLLLSTLVLAAGVGWRWAVAMVAAHLYFLPSFVEQFDLFHRLRVGQRIEAQMIDLRSYPVYDPTASGWSNTVLVPDVRLANRVRVAPGIGISWGVKFFAGGSKPPLLEDSPYLDYIRDFNDRWLSRPTKSHYLLLSPKQADKWKGSSLKLLKQFSDGNLYLNLDFADVSSASSSSNDSTTSTTESK
jgi:hypothetical protein